MTEIADGRRKGTGAKTVADLIERWFEWRKTNGDELSPGTAYNYERDIELRIIPALGRLPLRDLDPATLNDFYGRLRRHGGRCQRCARRIREGQAPMHAGERFEPRLGAVKQVHEPDCSRGFRLSASKIHQVHAILSVADQCLEVAGYQPLAAHVVEPDGHALSTSPTRAGCGHPLGHPPPIAVRAPDLDSAGLALPS